GCCIVGGTTVGLWNNLEDPLTVTCPDDAVVALPDAQDRMGTAGENSVEVGTLDKGSLLLIVVAEMFSLSDHDGHPSGISDIDPGGHIDIPIIVNGRLNGAVINRHMTNPVEAQFDPDGIGGIAVYN